MSRIELHRGGEAWASEGPAIDISIPLRFDGPQPSFFGARPASSHAMHAGNFIGDTRLSGSCNAERMEFIPHCHATHTECVGHLTLERVRVNPLATEPLLLAMLVTVETETETRPKRFGGNEPARIITSRALEDAAAGTGAFDTDALVIRTSPNGPEKCGRHWNRTESPYFSIEAMEWVVGHGIRHLLVDTPSVDWLEDERLMAHRTFWGLPLGAGAADDARSVADATRPEATITELVYVPDDVTDGRYLLDLQIAPIASDAAPSRPLLYRIVA